MIKKGFSSSDLACSGNCAHAYYTFEIKLDVIVSAE